MIQRTTLTTKEVSEYLGLSLDFVYKLARSGELPSVKVGSRVLFRVATVDKWLQEKEQESINATAEHNEQPRFEAI